MSVSLLTCLLILLSATATILTSATPTLSILGNLVVETSYGFPSLTALYQLYHPAISFVTPLQRTEDNVAALLAGQSDFSLIAGPLLAAQAAAHPNLTVLPVLGTAIVPVYRLDELSNSSRSGSSGTPLIFSGRTLALIFAGTITRWDDPSIAADNPGVRLSGTNITVAYQADSRVLNLVFTTALNKYEPSIADILPSSELPAWPVSRYAASRPGYGLTGVASNVVDNDGSIGFSLQPSALMVGATISWMYTALGGVIDADASSVSFAMTELLTVANLTSFADVTLCQSTFCWPVVIVSYLLMDNTASPRGCAVRSAVADFWLWYYDSYSTATEPMLSHWGLAPTPELITNEEQLASLLLSSILCNGVLAGTPSPTTQLSVYGPSRLSFLFDSTDEFINSGSDDHMFSYVSSDSLTAMTAAHETLALAAVYKDDIVAAGEGSAIDTSDSYMLPTFLTSIVFVYNTNLSPTVDAGNVTLTIDFKALMLIFAANITDWHHPYLVELNPVLSSLLDSNPAPITLVLACTSATSPAAPLLSYLTYYLAAYATADTVSEPYITAADNNTVELARFYGCDSTGVGGTVYAMSENTIAAQVVNLHGAIGYKMDDSAHNAGELTLLFPAIIDGHTVRTGRQSNPYSLLACATEQTFDATTLDLDAAAGYTNPDCYPLTQVVYMQVPRDYPINSSTTGYVTLSALQSLYSSSLVDGWFNNSMFVRATQLPFLQAALIAAVDSVTSNGDTLLVTLPRVWVLSTSVRWSGFMIALVGVCCTLSTLGVFVWYSEDTRLRASSPLIMAISLVGIVCMYVSVLLLVLTPSAATCSGLGWMGQIGYTLTFAPLLAKAYRIYRIFGRKRLRVIRITDRHLLLFVAAMLTVDALLLVLSFLLNGKGAMQPVSSTVTLSSDMRQHVYTDCQPAAGAASVVFTIEAIIKSGMLVGGVLLAFATRGVADEFNESRSIALAVYNLVLVLLLIVPILVVVNAVGDAFVILLLFLIAWIATFTLGVLFIPKLVAFLASPHSLTSPVVRHRSLSHGQQFSFLSVSSIPSSAALLPYLTALDKHTLECKRLLDRLRHKEGLTLTSLRPSSAPVVPQLPDQRRMSGIQKGGQVVQYGDLLQAVQRVAVWPAVTLEEVRLDGEAEGTAGVEAGMLGMDSREQAGSMRGTAVHDEVTVSVGDEQGRVQPGSVK